MTTTQHQPGQDVFRSIREQDIDFQPFAAFPPGVLLAVVVGDTTKPGPFTIRVKASAGAKLPPHRHHEDRVYTVISGVFYIGQGEEFDPDKLQAYPARRGRRAARRDAALPLGEVRRVRHPDHGARADQPRRRPPRRRSPALRSDPAARAYIRPQREPSRPAGCPAVSRTAR